MAMAQEKKGGPYTKHEQKERRKKVYNLHFEKCYSAIKIAEMLHVNRNTINEDIKYGYASLSEDLPDNSPSLLLKQIQRLETQQARLLEELEKSTDFKSKVIIEKLLFAVNSKSALYTSKIAFHSYDVLYKLRNDVNNENWKEFDN